MSILDLYENGSQRKNKGHFRNLVLLATADGAISEEENALLDRIAKKISLSEKQVEEIKKNPKSFNINPPTSKEERLERLINLEEMVEIEGEDIKEMKMAVRFGIGLGYREESVVGLMKVIKDKRKEGLKNFEILDYMMKLKA